MPRRLKWNFITKVGVEAIQALVGPLGQVVAVAERGPVALAGNKATHGLERSISAPVHQVNPVPQGNLANQGLLAFMAETEHPGSEARRSWQ